MKVAVKRNEERSGNKSEFVIDFSPDNKWIVARAYFEDIHVWRVAESASAPANPVVQTTKSDEGQSLDIDFSSNGQWIAGIAADHALYVWQLEKSQSAKIEPSIPKDKDASRMKFSPLGNWIAGSIASGGVYIWKPGDSPNILEPIARHDTAGKVSFYWCDDNKHIFTTGGSDVYWGETGQSLQLLIREKSKIVDLANTQGHQDLLVFGENHLSIIRRKLYFWDIPIYTYTWPSLMHASKDVTGDGA